MTYEEYKRALDPHHMAYNKAVHEAHEKFVRDTQALWAEFVRSSHASDQ